MKMIFFFKVDENEIGHLKTCIQSLLVDNKLYSTDKNIEIICVGHYDRSLNHNPSTFVCVNF
jgi:hypothetical protein